MTTPNPNSAIERPRSVTILGWLLILSSFGHISTLLFGVEWYRSNFSYWPDWVFWSRYCFSWLQRLLGLTAGIGFLYGDKICRKIALAIAIFTITTVYWKHHYPAFQHHCQWMYTKFGGGLLGIAGADNPAMRETCCYGAYLMNCFGDVTFCLALIYYLTLPSVKEYFQKSNGSIF
jgi:hypothetical protein